MLLFILVITYGGLMSKEIDYSTIQLEDVDMADYPDFCDAFVSYAEYKDGTPLSDEDLEALNEDRYIIHELVFDSLY